MSRSPTPVSSSRSATPFSEQAEEEKSPRWHEAVRQIFLLLDKEGSGSVSSYDVDRMIEAMNAESNAVPEAPQGRVMNQHLDLINLKDKLLEWEETSLEDLSWFIESVNRVEYDLKAKWRSAVSEWKEVVDYLNDQGVARLLLRCQPERIAKWLTIRVKGATDGVSTKFIHKVGGKQMFRLSMSQREVEILFDDKTHTEVLESLHYFKPCFKLQQLFQTMLAEASSGDDSLGNAVSDIYNLMEEYKTQTDVLRDMACVLVSQHTLSHLTQMMVINNLSKYSKNVVNALILRLLDFHFEISNEPIESDVKTSCKYFIEMVPFPSPEEMEEAAKVPESVSTVCPRYGVTDWVSQLITQEDDYDRGKNLDMLINWDRARLTTAQGSGQPPARSLMSHGNVIALVISRMRMDSYHMYHETRTPIRTHIVKFLFNILQGAGDEGRARFREAGGMWALSQVLRGRKGKARHKLPSGQEFEEFDFDEEDTVEQRYYEEDFSDNQFYGEKDKMKVVQMLMCLMDEDVWGEEVLANEMMECPNLLENLFLFGEAPLEIFNLILSHPAIDDYIENYMEIEGDMLAQQQLHFLQPGLAATHDKLQFLADLEPEHVNAFKVSLSRSLGRNKLYDLFIKMKVWLESWEMEATKVTIQQLVMALPMTPAEYPSLAQTVMKHIHAYLLETRKEEDNKGDKQQRPSSKRGLSQGSRSSSSLSFSSSENSHNSKTSSRMSQSINRQFSTMGSETKKLDKDNSKLVDCTHLLELANSKNKLPPYLKALTRRLDLLTGRHSDGPQRSFATPDIQLNPDEDRTATLTLSFPKLEIKRSLLHCYQQSTLPGLCRSIASAADSMVQLDNEGSIDQLWVPLAHYLLFQLCWTSRLTVDINHGLDGFFEAFGWTAGELRELATHDVEQVKTLIDRDDIQLVSIQVASKTASFVKIHNTWHMCAVEEDLPLSTNTNVVEHFST